MAKWESAPVYTPKWASAPVFGQTPAPEKPEEPEKGFFGDVGTLLKQGATQALSTYEIGPQVIAGDVEGTAGLIAKNLGTERFRPEAMRQVEEAFKEEGQAFKEAPTWYSPEGLRAIGGTVAEIGKQLVTNPRGVVYFTAEQAANMVPAIVGSLSGAAVGAPAGPFGVAGGAFVGSFSASAPMEIGAEFIGIVGGELAARGLPPTEENVKSLLSDAKFRDTAVSQARVKGATVAAVDAATTFVGGRIASAPMRSAVAGAARESLETGADVTALVQRNLDALPLSEKLVAGAKGYGVDVAGAGVGETAGQVAAYGEADLEEVALEVLGEAGGAIVEVPALGKKFVSTALKTVRPGENILVRPVPTAEQSLNQATNAGEAVTAAAKMVDVDIEALEREAGIAQTIPPVPAGYGQNLAAGRGLLEQVMPSSVTFGEEPVAEPTLTVERLMQADISTMPAPERQEFLNELTAARTANLPEQRQQALTRAAEVYGRTVGPIQTRAPAAPPAAPAPVPGRVKTEGPDMQTLMAADTTGMTSEDRSDFVSQLGMARQAGEGPVRQAALTRAAEIYGRTIGPIQPATLQAPTPQAPSRRTTMPRPTKLLDRPTSEYTESQLQALINNDRTPAVTRRGAEIELRARAEIAQTLPSGTFAPTLTPNRETNATFITLPELENQPVVAQSTAEGRRATAQQRVNDYAAANNQQPMVSFGAPSAELEAGLSDIVKIIGSELGGEVVAFSDTSPTAVNGVAIGKTAFVNVGSPDLNVGHTSLHEFKHTVEQIANAESSAGLTGTAAQEFVEQIDSIFDDITEAGKRSYIENLLYTGELSGLQGSAREAKIQELLQNPELRSEMTADFLGNRADDRQFWDQLAKADPTGFEGFVKRWLAAIDNLLAKLRGAKNQQKLESKRVDSYIRDLNKAKLTAQSALINYRKATQAQTAVADDLAAKPNDVVKAEAFEDKYGILPYTSAGQLSIDARFSIKQVGDYGIHPVLGIPVNKNGSVTLYFPTDNTTANQVRKDKVLRGADPSATRIYLTNESSAPKVAATPGEIKQPLAGANVLVQVDPNLVQLLQEHEDGRKDFFIPIAEGATFKTKMTKLFTLNAPRDQGLHSDRTLAEIQDGIRVTIGKLRAASAQKLKQMVADARKVLRAEHNVGTLLGENDKLAKTRTGDYGIEYKGKRVYSLGLGLASAQKINNKQKLTSCPQSAICESLCLGETSGQNLLYGGVGQFRSGPRLAQYLKTEAMVVHPEEFAAALYAEIDSFRLAMMKEGKQPTIRLNVTSDFAPKVWEPLIKAFPDVVFYDYTKLASDPIADNHHLTYSSTGASQVVNGKLIDNKLSNWPRMIERLRSGKNVAMAFTSKTDMPDFVVDEASGERFQVWNGDEYDARFLDPKPGEPANKFNKGMVIGLTNKDRTGPAETAAERTGGFFMDYDRKRDGDTLTIRDPRALESDAARPVRVQFSRRQKETSGAIKAAPGVDMVRMARLLGPQLYGNMSDIGLVTIKEVFQNSFDALKGAIQKGDKNIGRIDIDLDGFDRTITITDDGTGMTPEIINKAFLTLAGTAKETDRASGGLGIAKMLFLFGNESLSLRTVRNGVESTLSTSGAELMASFSDPSVAPDIQTRSTNDPSGTTIKIKIPKTYTDENGEVKSIDFPYSYRAKTQLIESPLMENIEVRLNDEVLPIGSSFPAEDYTVLTNAKFAWGNMRVLVRPKNESEYGNNIQVLSNGLFQFDDEIKKNPLDFWGPSAPFKFYFNIEPSVPADSPLYPIALNRKAFSASAKADFDALKKYLGVLYANKTDAESAQSFGDLEQLSEDGRTFKQISLVIPEAEKGSTLAINPGDKVEVREGRMYVNNRETPEITKESMAKLVRDPGKFRIDPSLIDPSRVLVHDNLTLNGVPFREVMRDSVGDAFDDFTFEVAEVFKNLRDAVAKVGGAKYSNVSDVAVGVSFDLEYYGVNIMVPFRAMMINPAFIRGEDPAKAAQTVVGTMIHELAHHAERNHNETGFIPELQRLFMELSLSRDSEAITRQLQNVFNKYPDIMRELRRIQDNEKANLKPKGVRLKGDADTTGVGGMDVSQKARDGASAAARLSAPGGARRDDSDLPGIRRAVEGSGRDRPIGEERRRPSSTDSGYDPGLALRDLIPRQLRTTDPSAADEFIAFSKRQKPAPKKTVTAYKLFRVDARRPGQLFPLFVNANEPVPFNEWQDADIGPRGEGGKVKSKLGLLAFRPGWHAGDLPVATHIGSKSDSSLRAPDVRSENQVWAEVEMAADRNWQKVADERGRNAQGKIIGSRAQISDQIPKDGFYRYKTSPNMVGKWIIGGSMKVNRLLTDAEVEQINSAAGVADLPRQEPFDAKKYGFEGKQGGAPSQQRGINVRNDGDNRYADLIVDGEKTMESRNTDSLRAYVGRTVGIIRTGEGPARLIGSVKIGEPIQVDEQEFRELEPEHLVPKDSTFDIKPGSTKFLYPLTEAQRFDEERAVDSRGIVARDVAFSRKQEPTNIEDARLRRFSRNLGERVRERAAEMTEMVERLIAEDKYLGLEVGDTFFTQNQDGGRFRSRVLAKSVLPWRDGEYELNGKTYTPTLRVETINPDGEVSTSHLLVNKLRGRFTKMGGPQFSRKQTIDVDGVQRSTTNSKGDPIAQTEESLRNFWRWFGDSKVVDAEGKPLVVYHGTWLDFDAFRGGRLGGMYFTEDLTYAKDYGDTVLAVYLKSENLADVASPSSPVYKMVVDEFNAAGGMEIDEDIWDYAQSQGRTDPMFDPSKDVTWELLDFPELDLPSMLLDAGYDGIKLEERRERTGTGERDIDSYVVFKPNNIKSVDNLGSFDPADQRFRFSRRQTNPMKLYSALARAAEAGPVRAPAAQWKGLLRKQAKPEEITWSGVEDWLDLQEGNVSREAVSEFLAQNGVQVGEVVLGGFKETVYPEGTYADVNYELVNTLEGWRAATEDYSSYGGPSVEEQLNDLIDVSGQPIREARSTARYDEYQLPGGTNYREVLLTLPEKKIVVLPDGYTVTMYPDEPIARAKAGYVVADETNIRVGYNTARLDGRFDTAEEAIKGALKSLNEGAVFSKLRGSYRSSHWYQPNVLAHIRMNDRVDADGSRVLFVEELQSDWAQEGRKKGFAKKSMADTEMVATINNSANRPYWEVRTTSGYFVANVMDVDTTTGTPEQAIAMAREIASRRVDDRPPVAPFVQTTDSWLNLALKRVITMAVEEGYDKVAFINGEQSADRYDLSNQIQSLRYRKSEDGTFVVAGTDVNGSSRDFGRAVPEEYLEDLFGKEIAQKILAGEGKTLEKYPRFRVLSGLDLKVGGEGMKTFYDSIVPKAISKLLPKIGGRELGTVEIGRLEQPGFTVTREMTDQVMDAGLPMFSRRQNIFGQPMPAGGWQVGDSRIDDVIYSLQDKLVDTKRVIESIKTFAGNIADKFDAYLQETLYHGRVSTRTKNFAETELDPLIEAMKRNNVTIDQIDEYLHNRHAEERNIAMAKRDPNQRDGLSGITTADARAYLAAIPTARRALLEGLARRVDAITAGTRQALLDAGLESQGMLNAWENTYSAYVPLMREELDYDPAGGPGTGAGFNVRGSASRRAVGSTDRKVVDILANVAMQRERAIVRAEKNRVSKALYGLAIQNPLPDFWLPINLDAAKDPAALQAELISLGLSVADAQNIAQQPKERVVDPRTGIVTERPNHRLLTSATVITARVNGKDRFLVLNPQNPRAERMAKALKNLDADQLGRAMGIIAQGTRWFASVNTQYNPIFGVINFLRDVQGGLLNLSSTELKGEQGKVLADTLPALRGIYADLRTRGAAGQWSQLWREFQEVGGQTGYRDQFSQSAERTKVLQAQFNALSNGTAKKAGKAVGEWLSDYNTAMENAVRLSAYKAGLDKGMSKERAAALAKNLTVNFNKKGQVATQMGALYAFFNASVQGTTRLVETLRGPAGKKIIYGGLLLGSAQALAMAMAGFDEEEPPEFTRERNIIIPTGDGKYLTVPMPLGFNVIPNFSRIVTEWALSGFERTPQRVAQIATSIFEMFNPIGNAGLSIQTLAPSVFDPLVALGENKDWTGTPIAREDFNSLDPTPGYTRAKDTASEFSKAMAEFLNLASGGTEFAPGVVSPTPDQLDYLIGQITGGIGREYLKAEQTVTSAVTGEELPTYKIPLIGRFGGDTTGSSATSSRFYEAIRRMNIHNNELGGRREAGRPVGEYLRENPEARLAPQALRTYRQVQDLRRRKREMLERDASKESIRMIEEQITRRMQQFNDRLESM